MEIYCLKLSHDHNLDTVVLPPDNFHLSGKFPDIKEEFFKFVRRARNDRQTIFNDTHNNFIWPRLFVTRHGHNNSSKICTINRLEVELLICRISTGFNIPLGNVMLLFSARASAFAAVIFPTEVN